jgi:hypothetical protein
MSTTSILVEILIIGMQASVWLSIVILSLFGYQWVPSSLALVKGWEALLSVLGLGLCYTLGIFVDRAADCLTILYHPGDTLLKFSWIKRHADAAHRDMRMQVLCSANKATDFLAQIRSRIRIARATTLNIMIASFATISYLAVRTEYATFGILSCVVLLGAFLSFASIVGLGVLEVTYFTRLKQAKFYMQADTQDISEAEK